MGVFLLLLIIVALSISLVSMQTTKKTEIVRDTVSASVRTDTRPEIQERYFRMRMDLYLKKRYQKLIGWEFLDDKEIHFLSSCNRIMLHLREDDVAETVPSLAVWEDGYRRLEDEIPDDPEDNNNSTQEDNEVIKWITDNIGAIEKEIEKFKPDVIIALGGGSPIDAAKGMWLFYEQPDADIEGLKLKFMDIRKRTYKFPKLGEKAKMVAIPTTSGTGSEVTSFAVISDKQQGKKYPLADYELTPDVAIIDPDLVMSLPKKITADTGMDVLTHAIEAYVSNMASDYTDGLSEKAVEIVFEYLYEAYEHGDNKIAREKMHNASTIAGMAFTNAFLGINHSLAHKLGAEFHIAHGRANAILLPYVIRYNSEKPTKFVSFPKYEYFIADEKYANLAKKNGMKANTIEEGVNSLIENICKLNEKLGIPKGLKDEGIDEQEFLSKVDNLADRAFEDQCTTANPRLPLVSELKQILLDAYYGK